MSSTGCCTSWLPVDSSAARSTVTGPCRSPLPASQPESQQAESSPRIAGPALARSYFSAGTTSSLSARTAPSRSWWRLCVGCRRRRRARPQTLHSGTGRVPLPSDQLSSVFVPSPRRRCVPSASSCTQRRAAAVLPGRPGTPVAGEFAGRSMCVLSRLLARRVQTRRRSPRWDAHGARPSRRNRWVELLTGQPHSFDQVGRQSGRWPGRAPSASRVLPDSRCQECGRLLDHAVHRLVRPLSPSGASGSQSGCRRRPRSRARPHGRR